MVKIDVIYELSQGMFHAIVTQLRPATTYGMGMGKPDWKRRLLPRPVIGAADVPEVARPPAAAVAPGATLRVSLNPDGTILRQEEPAPQWAEINPPRQPIDATLSPLQVFLHRCLDDAKQQNLGGFEEPLDRRFAAALLVGLTSRTLRKVLESPYASAQSFASGLSVAMLNQTVNYQKGAAAGSYDFMLDATADGYRLKPEIVATIEPFARSFYEANKDLIAQDAARRAERNQRKAAL